MNNKDIKNLFDVLIDQFGIDKKDLKDLEYVFLMSDKNRVYLINKDVGNIDLDTLYVNTMGMYLGELCGEEFRFSIEGTQLFGPYAKKAILKIRKDQVRKWLRGEEIDVVRSDIDKSEWKYIIVKCYETDEFLGSGKIKGERVLNYIPKTRRIMSSD
jgi:NOL1/NOP2/fmu family ribosome biogenesis protein